MFMVDFVLIYANEKSDKMCILRYYYTGTQTKRTTLICLCVKRNSKCVTWSHRDAIIVL